MGKDSMRKNNRGARHDPLHVEMADNSEHATHHRTPRQKFAMRNDHDDEIEEYLDPKLSKKILQIARKQQEQIEARLADEEENTPTKSLVSKFPLGYDPSDDELDDEDKYGPYEELEIEEEDAEVLSKFLPSAPKERRTLADIIMEKINEKNTMDTGESRTKPTDDDEHLLSPLVNPKVVEVYTKVGQLLSRYKSGKLPKAFKIIPALSNWEEIVYITKPESWSPQAIYQATRMFISTLKANCAQKFLSLVLLDRIRDDIKANNKLNYHLYKALKKAIYKPNAFFKGILFPLCESGTCTLKEAAIVGSVISKVSIPSLHSAAALMRLAEADYTGPNSLFIRILLDKKYALPYKVVDALVMHFTRFRNDPRIMPVLWHQSLLVFAQRYKTDLIYPQKTILLDVIKHKFHPDISPEIRREIVNSIPRDELEEEYDDGDFLLD